MLRELSQGMRGEDVRAVQQGLNNYFRGRGQLLRADGVFGPKTKLAVEIFQKENARTGNRNGSPDGIVGARTRHKLFSLVVMTIHVHAFRLRLPSSPGLPRSPGPIRPPRLGPGPLLPPGTPRPPGLNPSPYPRQIDWSKLPKFTPLNLPKIDFSPQRFPGLPRPLPVPRPVLPSLLTPTLPNPAGKGLAIDHFELAAGVSTTAGKPAESSFGLSLQAVAVIGDDRAAHHEIAGGVQMGTPSVDGSGEWSTAYYVQYTHVDLFGKLGQFHWWQPYAQIASQLSTNKFQPVLVGSLAPVNTSYDVNDVLTISIGAGAVMTYDPSTGRIQAGFQTTGGIVVKFGSK